MDHIVWFFFFFFSSIDLFKFKTLILELYESYSLRLLPPVYLQGFKNHREKFSLVYICIFYFRLSCNHNSNCFTKEINQAGNKSKRFFQIILPTNERMAYKKWKMSFGGEQGYKEKAGQKRKEKENSFNVYILALNINK